MKQQIWHTHLEDSKVGYAFLPLFDFPGASRQLCY
jgi:hypothetical protein